MPKMKITFNGSDIEIEENSTINDFIRERNVTGTMFVIEKNREIVDRANYASEFIKTGDCLELVGFVGGG